MHLFPLPEVLTHPDHLWVSPTQRKRIWMKICLVDSQYQQRRGGERFGAPLGSLGSMWDRRGRVGGTHKLL